MGCLNVTEMLDSMSHLQWLKWKRMWALDPWGGDRGDHRIGLLATVIGHLFAGLVGKTETWVEPRHCMPYAYADEAEGVRQVREAEFEDPVLSFAKMHSAALRWQAAHCVD